MPQRSLHIGRGASLLLACSCFSTPPAAGADDETGGSTSSATSVTPTSGVTLTGSTEPSTGTGTGSSTSALTGSSSSGADVSTGSSSTGELDTTSGSESADTTAGLKCEDGRVEIDGVCLTPLTISSAATVPGGAGGGLFDDEMPCLSASCGEDLPLGGGFEAQNVMLHASEADFELGSWGICGAPVPDATPNVWDVFARCAVADGDVLPMSEVFPLEDDSLGCWSVGCPEGTVLVGGGGQWGPEFRVTGMEPTDDGQWQVCGRSFGGTPQVEVHAYCAVLSEGASVALVEEIQSVSALDLGCAQAVCSSGVAIAGGGDGGVVSATLEVSRPVDNAEAWSACGRAILGSGQIRSRVLCYQP